MRLIDRCPLTGIPCGKAITIEDKSFFLAEAEKPEDVRKRRLQAINVAVVGEYKIRSALDEKGINAFTCKICEMIQTCAYGMADISDNNPNVLFELGIMIALGKPTVILSKKHQELGLKLPSDLNAIEIIPFEEYIDVIEQLRAVLPKLSTIVPSSSPIQNLEIINPAFAEELRRIETSIVREFRSSIEKAKLDTISIGEEQKAVSPELNERLMSLEKKLENMSRLGLVTDASTAFLRGNYFYNQGKYEEALASYNRSLEVRPDHPDTLTNRGATYLKLERYDEALADDNRSLKLRPDHPTTLNNRGNTYLKMERYDEALADYDRSLKLRPDDPITLYNLACLSSLQNNKAVSLNYLVRAIAIGKKYRDMAKTDTDFDNIRDDPDFKKLIES